MQPRLDTPPAIDRGAEFIYGRHLLMRTAAAVLDAESADGWAIPSQVPSLVAAVYGESDLVPDAWATAAQQAQADWEIKQNDRRQAAGPFLLSRPGERALPHLDGLHYAATEAATEDHLAATVRDGDMSLEVILLVQDSAGYRTLEGQRLGSGGTPSGDLLETLAGDMMRLPQRLTPAAIDNLSPLPGWNDHAWLRNTRALVLSPSLTATIGEYAVSYDAETGLAYTRT
jgi:CRISPR-associated endonuclease/helicase Cas3